MCEYNIGAKLVELRTAKGATQEEVATALSVSNKTVSKWENGMSAPDLATLVALARYYNVSADVLLGIGTDKRTVESFMTEQFANLSCQEAALRTFELSRAIFPASYGRADYGKENVGEVLPESSPWPRCQISVPELFNFSVCSDDVNLTVMQLRNKAKFGWLTDGEKQKDIARLLAFLADPDAMKLCTVLHWADFETDFYAERAAERAGISTEKATALLEAACEIPDFCEKTVAHLVSGERTIYSCTGNGLILSILSLAHVVMSDDGGYQWNYSGGCKMIGG